MEKVDLSLSEMNENSTMVKVVSNSDEPKEVIEDSSIIAGEGEAKGSDCDTGGGEALPAVSTIAVDNKCDSVDAVKKPTIRVSDLSDLLEKPPPCEEGNDISEVGDVNGVVGDVVVLSEDINADVVVFNGDNHDMVEGGDIGVKVFEPCFYCEDLSFDVTDLASYTTHLREVHFVSKNLGLLADMTVKVQQTGGDGERFDTVSPVPFNKVPLTMGLFTTGPLIKEQLPFKMPENLSDIESDDDEILCLEEGSSIKLKVPLDSAKENSNNNNECVKIKPEITEETAPKKTVDTTDEVELTIEKVQSLEASKSDKIIAEGSPVEGTVETSIPEVIDAKTKGTDEKDSDPDTIILNVNKHDEFETIEDWKEEKGDKHKTDDALSDLSLSDDDFNQSSSDWVVLDEDISDEKEKVNDDKEAKEEKICTKCDTPHKFSERCSFILSSSRVQRDREGRGRGGGLVRPSFKRQKVDRVRTLPPALYNNPDARGTRGAVVHPSEGYEDRRGGFRRSRSPGPSRRAPSPPSLYERERDKAAAREREERQRRVGDKREEKVGGRACKLCESKSHLVKNCPDLFCYKCNQQGHFAKECTSSSNLTTTPKPPSVEKSRPSHHNTPGYPTPNTYTSQQQTGYAQYYPPGLSQPPPPAPPSLPSLMTPTPGYSAPYSAPPQPTPPPPPQDTRPSNYQESLHSLQPLQVFMSARMTATSGPGYPQSYIDLLVTNVGKMLAQANLGLPQLGSAFSLQGETYVRTLLSRELAVYAERFPGGVNLPFITETTVEYLKLQIQQYPSYVGAARQ